MTELQLMIATAIFLNSIFMVLWVRAECRILQLERKIWNLDNERLAQERELDYFRRHAGGMETYIDELDRD